MDGESSDESKTSRRRVGLLYDERMCKYHTPDCDHHPENPNRIRAIWNKLQNAASPRRFIHGCLPCCLLCHGAEVGPATAWRSELSKVDVWYATFGSNMWKPRFLCYIEGGQVEGMRQTCPGAKDTNPPKEILWKSFPHCLFFGYESCGLWGPGGVSFLNPECNIQHEAYLLLYRISLEQFNDILVQENFDSYDMSSPLFDINDLNSIATKKSIPLEALKEGWYCNVLYLGKECDIPILTMTCSPSDVENFKSGELPLCAPAIEYANILIKGLVEGKQLSYEEAMAYIHEASTKPL